MLARLGSALACIKLEILVFAALVVVLVVGVAALRRSPVEVLPLVTALLVAFFAPLRVVGNLHPLALKLAAADILEELLHVLKLLLGDEVELVGLAVDELDLEVEGVGDRSLLLAIKHDGLDILKPNDDRRLLEEQEGTIQDVERTSVGSDGALDARVLPKVLRELAPPVNASGVAWLGRKQPHKCYHRLLGGPLHLGLYSILELELAEPVVEVVGEVTLPYLSLPINIPFVVLWEQADDVKVHRVAFAEGGVHLEHHVVVVVLVGDDEHVLDCLVLDRKVVRGPDHLEVVAVESDVKGGAGDPALDVLELDDNVALHLLAEVLGDLPV
mmetsp:Transcript_23182/g.58077  ORF Transcript_23182/g.58077 Transcript_23182/m.58077 type:complete len:329 (-) Transcript_23182:614-1600(-)